MFTVSVGSVFLALFVGCNTYAMSQEYNGPFLDYRGPPIGDATYYCRRCSENNSKDVYIVNPTSKFLTVTVHLFRPSYQPPWDRHYFDADVPKGGEIFIGCTVYPNS